MIRMNMDYQNKGKHQWTENQKTFRGNFSSLIIHTWLCIEQYWWNNQHPQFTYKCTYNKLMDKFEINTSTIYFIEPLNIENAMFN